MCVCIDFAIIENTPSFGCIIYTYIDAFGKALKFKWVIIVNFA